MGRFLVLFIVYLAAGVVLINLSFVESALIEPWTRFNATASAVLASVVGIDVVATGTTLQLPATRLEVLGGCNGVHAVLILLVSILAFPAPWSRKLAGMAAGTVGVLGFNILRLVNLIVVAHVWPSWLDLFHLYIWQTLIVLIAFALFLVWGTYFADSGPSKPAAAST